MILNRMDGRGGSVQVVYHGATNVNRDMSRLSLCTIFIFQLLSHGIVHAIAFAMLTKRIRVLVAEDDEANARVARTILERLGCAADLATNGVEAIEYFGRHTYDLILMDWQMPVMDGIEATARIRGMPHGKTTPIVGTTSRGDHAECLAAGMNDVVPKPFLFEKLRPVLARWTNWTNWKEPDVAEA